MGNAIQFSVGLDLAQLQSGARQSQAVMASTMGQIRQSSGLAMGAMAGATAVAFQKITAAAVQASDKVRGVFSTGAELQKLSERTGISAGRLAMIQRAFKSVDMATEKLAPTINKMQLRLATASAGSSTAVAAFSDLGLELAVLKKMAPDAQFLATAQAISALHDPAARTAAAVAMFSEAGAELLPLFSNAGAVEMMGGKLSAQAQVFEQSSASFYQANLKLSRAGKEFQGFYVGMASGIAGPLTEALGQLNTGDWVAKGKAFGEMIGGGLQNLAAFLSDLSGLIAGVMGLGLKLWGIFKVIGNVLYVGALKFGDLMLAGIFKIQEYCERLAADLLDLAITVPAKLASGLEFAFQKAMEFFGNGMWDLIADIQAGLQFAIYTAIAKAVALLPAALKKFLHIGDLQAKSFAQFQESAKQNYAGKKSGKTAESYAEISRRREAEARAANPGLAASIGQGRRNADTLRDRAAAKYADAAGKKEMPFDADAAFRAGNAMIAQSLRLLNQPKGATIAEKPDLNKGATWDYQGKLASFKNFTPSLLPTSGIGASVGGLGSYLTGAGERAQVQGGLTGGAYGYVRHGDAARRKQAMAEEKQKALEKNKSAEGTNERLDTLIAKQEEYWG